MLYSEQAFTESMSTFLSTTVKKEKQSLVSMHFTGRILSIDTAVIALPGDVLET